MAGGALVTVEKQKIVAAEGAIGDLFGSASSASGDTLVISASGDAAGGAAYVFVRAGDSWTQQQKLTPEIQGSGFGQAVAVQGDTVLIGAPYDEATGGAVYVFTRAGDRWSQQQKLTAADASAMDAFGYTLALDKETALVGAPGQGAREGAVYVFTRAGDSWSQQQKLTAADAAADSSFGQGMALDGNEALIGAPDRDSQKGKVYQFRRTGTAWTERQQITPPGAAIREVFGYGIAMSGGRAFISQPGRSARAGALFLFEQTGDSWTLRQQLSAMDGEGDSFFGYSVAFNGELALVGAPRPGKDDGAAYVISRRGDPWVVQKVVAPTDGIMHPQLGETVALTGLSAVVGVPYQEDSQGAAYAFSLQRERGEACKANAECAGGFCADGVCCDSACGASDAGDCQACSRAAGAASDGTCALLPASVTCRAAAGVCDAAEQCTGADPLCPGDALAPAGQVCRESTGPSDPAELCSGVSATCGSEQGGPDMAGASPGRISGGGLSCAVGRPTSRSGPPGSALLAGLASLGLLLRRRARRAGCLTRDAEGVMALRRS